MSDLENSDENEYITPINVVLISESNIALEPVMLPSSTSPDEGVENPIVRSENPHYVVDPIKKTIEARPVKSSPVNRSPKRKRTYDDMNKAGETVDDDDVASSCPICLEHWTNAGQHRLCALKCGHLFGKSCLNRWFRDYRNSTCPTCKKKARRHDIRDLYATKLLAVDTVELETVHNLYKNALEEKRGVENELERLRKLMKELEKHALESSQGPSAAGSTQMGNTYKAVYTYLLEGSSLRLEDSRVMAYSPLWDLVAISDKSTTPLWPGYGVRLIKASCSYAKGFTYLQKKVTRDLAFHPTTPEYVLCASFDNVIRVADVSSHNVILSFQGEGLQWSCCWDLVSTDQFYVGNNRGDVMMFDLNAPSAEPTLLPRAENEQYPVLSMQFSAIHNHLVVCRLQSVTIYKKTSSKTFERISVPVAPGWFYSMCYDDVMNRLILAYRASEDVNALPRHICYELNQAGGCVEQRVFRVGNTATRMSRGHLLISSHHQLYFAFNESQRQILAWNMETYDKVLTMQVSEDIVDLLCIERSSNTLQLLTLSANLFKCYSITKS